MSRTGRPKLMQKEGHHRHDGYGRWHPIDQSHGNKTNLLHKEQLVSKDDDSVAGEIYNLVTELEKMETVSLLVGELQKSIETLIERNKNKPRPRTNPAKTVEQETLGKEDSEEERQPNTIGLP